MRSNAGAAFILPAAAFILVHMKPAWLALLPALLLGCAAPAAMQQVAEQLEAPATAVSLLLAAPQHAASPTPIARPTALPTLAVERQTELPFATYDRPDDVEGYQVHFIYALPKDGTDALLDVSGEIEMSATAMNHWLFTQTGSRLRYDTYEGALDITFVQLPYTAEQISQVHSRVNDLLEYWIKVTGLAQDNKLYVVHYDGFFVTAEGYCGLAPLPPDGLGQTAVLLLRGYNPTYDLTCPRSFTRSADYTGFFEITILHEVLHLMGLVAACAPNAEGGHVNDSSQDLMYYAYDGSYSPLFTNLDFGNNDYYNHGVADCPDLARSVFLDPLPADAELPPRWEHSLRNIPPDPIGGMQ